MKLLEGKWIGLLFVVRLQGAALTCEDLRSVSLATRLGSVWRSES